jgi:hypothetical protein
MHTYANMYAYMLVLVGEKNENSSVLANECGSWKGFVKEETNMCGVGATPHTCFPYEAWTLVMIRAYNRVVEMAERKRKQ